MLGAHKTEDGPADAALKRPIKSTMLPDQVNMTKFNKAVIMVEYEKNSENLLNRKDIEIDDPCKLKQGYIGIVNREVPFNANGGLNLT